MTSTTHRTGVQEAIESLRHKPVKSTTLERLRLCVEAHAQVAHLPQPLQLGQTLQILLARSQLPLQPHDLILGRMPEEVPDEAGEAFFQETLRTLGRLPKYMADRGHESFAWDRLVRLGLPGLEALAVQALAQRRQEGATQDTLDFLQGMILIYQAFRTYAQRYGEAARAAGMQVAADNCLPLADRAPQTFREALQLVWLVGMVYCTRCAANPTLTFGRMDEYLLPLFRKDHAAGTLSMELAGELIEDFYCKHSLIMGRGEHQMSGGSDNDTSWDRNLDYDAPQYLILGGTRRDGSASANELTRLFLERVVPRFKNPFIVLRYTEDFPADLWQTACAKMSANAAMMVYNDAVLIPSLLRSGVALEDAIAYEMFGCNHPDIPGIRRRWGCAENLPACLLETLRRMVAEETGAPLTLDALCHRFIAVFREHLTPMWKGEQEARASVAAGRPGWLRVDDCFLAGPVEHACSADLGSMTYFGTLLFVRFVATLIDSFAAIDEVVFRSQRTTLAGLVQALENDFADNEPLRQYCLNAPKFGQDAEAADAVASRVLNLLYACIDEVVGQNGKHGAIALCSFETDTTNISEGSKIGATPDGRHAGQPLSMNAGPTWGAATRGLTAMLHSLARLPKGRICAGAVNIRISPALVRGDANLQRFAAVLRTYFSLGGLQAQLTIADAEELHRAQANPEQYRDLMIRITGYSATFVDMSKAGQDSIIQRTEMNR